MGDQPLLLDGIQVVDFSQAAFGPVATRLLADLGADVIRVEPLEGDFTRLTAEPMVDSITFIGNNLNKRSIAVNLRDERAMEAVRKLCDRADVVVQNFRPGVMDRMGLGYEELSKTNPRLVYGSFSMFGETGPLTHRRGGDMWAQAFAGFVDSQTDPEIGEPWVNGHNVIDYGGGAVNAFGIMSALWYRERTGKGQLVTNNLVNTAVLLQWPAIAHYLAEGLMFKKEGRGGVRSRFPYAAYPTKDDGYVLTIFGQDDAEWPMICELLDIEYLLEDERYDTVEKRNQKRWELYPILDEAFKQRTRDEWVERFRAKRLRCDPCLDYAEFTAHPQFIENNLALKVDDPRDGEMIFPASPVRFSESPAPERAEHAPILGEHTAVVLRELGYSDEEIDEMNEQGAVGVAEPYMFEVKRQLAGRAAGGDRSVFRGVKPDEQTSGPASS